MPLFLNQPFPDFQKRPILFIDLEMSGLDVSRHEILEVAALRVTQPDFQIQNSYYTKVLPEHIQTGDPRSLEIAGYDPKTWNEAVPVNQMLRELAAFAPDCILAGWSVQNEWIFLNSALEKAKLPYFYDNYLIEVWTIAFLKYFQDPGIKRLSLANVCKKLGVYIEQHKPDSDIRATYEIFLRLIK